MDFKVWHERIPGLDEAGMILVAGGFVSGRRGCVKMVYGYTEGEMADREENRRASRISGECAEMGNWFR